MFYIIETIRKSLFFNFPLCVLAFSASLRENITITSFLIRVNPRNPWTDSPLLVREVSVVRGKILQNLFMNIRVIRGKIKKGDSNA